MSEDSCPKCESTLIIKNLDGKLECLNCGYAWDPELSAEENAEANRRREEDVEKVEDDEEEEMDGAILF
jgi:DNA-directed RNA polymerase subunit M/transcription elongation factor TFIIS